MCSLLFSQVPVNLKDRDAFHITLEEYLLAVTNLLEELASSPHHPHATSFMTSGRLVRINLSNNL